MREVHNICKYCGKHFKTYRTTAKCCSTECSYKTRESGRKIGVMLNCKKCGKEFYKAPCVTKKGGGLFCSQKCAIVGKEKRKKASDETKNKISKNHHNVKGENNPNWKGGISTEQTKYRNKTWKEYAVWREKVLKRDGYKCKDCNTIYNLHAHHIVARKTLPSAEFIRANGVTLCEKCHRKTDSWGSGKDVIPYNRKGQVFRYIMKVIPHNWQDYPTVGNYFYAKNGTIVIFCSDMDNDKYHTLIFAHEMIESALVISRKIKLSQIDEFDMKFERERGDGDFREPGDQLNAPYNKEHLFATKIERLIAKEMDITWVTYDKKVNEL